MNEERTLHDVVGVAMLIAVASLLWFGIGVWTGMVICS